MLRQQGVWRNKNSREDLQAYCRRGIRECLEKRRWLPCILFPSFPCSLVLLLPRFVSLELEDDVDCGLNFDRLAVQQIRPIDPLRNGVHRRLGKHRRTAYDMEILNAARL